MVKNFFDLSGSVAIITGANRGLGQYFARALAQAGADIVITSRALPSLEAFAAELEGYGSRVLPLALDVRTYDSIQLMVETAHDHLGRIDILVNNAGCNIREAAVDVSWDEWDTVVDTNLKGGFFVAQAVAKKMIPRRYGRVINIGSVTSVAGYSGITPYCASRGGVRQMTMSLAADWGRYGITVNCLAPGWFRTAQNKVLYENREWLDNLVERIPMQRPGRPDDMDGAIIFLASESSRYVTGQILLVDGGITTGALNAKLDEAPPPPSL